MSNPVWVWIVLVFIAIAALGYLALRHRTGGSRRREPSVPEVLAPPPAPPTAPGRRRGTGRPAGELTPEPPAVSPGPYPGSVLPAADGSFPSDEFTIKADDTLKRYVPPGSPYYPYARADMWFRSPADAEAAGFSPWHPSSG